MPELQTNGNKFQILNGNWLEGYPMPTPQPQTDNSLQLDTTGEYLVVGKKKSHLSVSQRRKLPKPLTPEEESKLFYTNVFLFWNCRDIIYQDSRMFLAPVPVKNGLAYTGTSGFRNPTLGVYLEWWERCQQAHITIEKGVADKYQEERLVWYIAGSPLSGSNVCSSVDKSGKTKTTPVYPFITLWRSFMEVNAHYDPIKPLYQAYTLEQVADILNQKEPCIQYKVLSEWQTGQIAELTEQRDEWECKYYRLLFEPYKDELTDMLIRYNDLNAKADNTSQKKEKELLRYWADTCIFDVLHKCYPDMITIRKDSRDFLPTVKKYI